MKASSVSLVLASQYLWGHAIVQLLAQNPHLRRLKVAIAKNVCVTPRRKHSSLFQLLENPELLEYNIC